MTPIALQYVPRDIGSPPKTALAYEHINFGITHTLAEKYDKPELVYGQFYSH